MNFETRLWEIKNSLLILRDIHLIVYCLTIQRLKIYVPTKRMCALENYVVMMKKIYRFFFFLRKQQVISKSSDEDQQ